MPTINGIDRLRLDHFDRLAGKRLGVACNQATVSRDYRHILELLTPGHQSGTFHVQAVFGPEHGLYGHTQDNMIEWEGVQDARSGFTIHSLYGTHREPTDAMMEGIELMVVDFPDIGSRYYTFAWTMALCMKACEEHGVPMLVLDRPNPIGGTQVEGTVLDPHYSSFVGLHPVPTRHGLTLGELARWVQAHVHPKAEVSVIPVEGWSRGQYLDETEAPWVLPSPNMPTVDTAVVYPGGCLLEGTNLSEGRGTTRPFEMFGAPFLDGWKLADALNGLGLPGVHYRPIQFEPTFNKHAGKFCEGCFIHVLDRHAYEPVLGHVAMLQEIIRQTGVADTSHLPEETVYRAASAETTLDAFAWKRPPYEYEFDKRPIDILAGNDWLRGEIENFTPLSEIRDRFRAECEMFLPARKAAMMYA